MAEIVPYAPLHDAPQPMSLERVPRKSYDNFGFSDDGTSFNSNETLAWQPRQFVHCDSEASVVAAVKSASSVNGRRVIPIGSGWSWSTTIASNDDVVYIKLGGELREINIDAEAKLAHCGGAVCAHELYPALQAAGLECEAHGICYTASVSQTVAGLLSTNVHAEGLKTFYDVCVSLDVVLSDGRVQTAAAGSELFNLTIGGAGETGVIIRATLALATRSSYRQLPSTLYVHPFSVCACGGFSAAHAAEQYLGEFEGPPPFNSKLVLAFAARGVVHATESYERLPAPEPNMLDLTPGWGSTDTPLHGCARLVGNCCTWNPCCATPCFGMLGAGCITTVTDPTPGQMFYTFPQLGCTALECQKRARPKSLDMASLFPNTLYLHHNEAEFYVPCELAVSVGRLLDESMPWICRRYIFAMRFVFGCDSLTAGNANPTAGARVDFVCFNFDDYRQSTWSTFLTDMDTFAAALHAAWPGRVHTHPGKYNCGGQLPRRADLPAVRAKIVAYDPSGMFARPAFDASVLLPRGRGVPKCCEAMTPQTCFITCY